MKNVVLIAAHKACPVPDDPLYLPVFVGSAGKPDNGFQRDDEGDNISTRNIRYSELTGLYWGWKHIECDNLGLVHYRRYFSLRPKDAKNGFLDAVLTSTEAESLLQQYRILVPKKRHYYIETIYSHYAHTFYGEQLDAAQEIIRDSCPEYLPAFRTFMKRRSGYMFNMAIMRKELFDQYCGWLFALLPRIEERVDDSGYTDFHRRWAGRVSERLFNVWLMHQIEQGTIRRQEIRELPYIYDGSVNWPKKIASFLIAKVFKKKYQKSF
ncbi:MAG: DUF4422 domain-containing protein [Solobacterium sp.]|nr:DUF4422 domain-containing protein [Solobacterium sp.]